MDQKRNYQKELDKELDKIQREGRVPSLLLQSCCAPCSSYVLEYLSRYFRITVYYYNPNITNLEEYTKRSSEQMRLITEMPARYPVRFMAGHYQPMEFLKMAKGLEDIPEGGERCFRCYEMRLRSTAELCRQEGFDYFTTTLTISPMKNAQKLNEIGEQLAREYNVSWLNSDFKKKNGYKRSIELSAEYELYRQNYCGCIFSERDRVRQEQQKEKEREALQKGETEG